MIIENDVVNYIDSYFKKKFKNVKLYNPTVTLFSSLQNQDAPHRSYSAKMTIDDKPINFLVYYTLKDNEEGVLYLNSIKVSFIKQDINLVLSFIRSMGQLKNSSVLEDVNTYLLNIYNSNLPQKININFLQNFHLNNILVHNEIRIYDLKDNLSENEHSDFLIATHIGRKSSILTDLSLPALPKYGSANVDEIRSFLDAYQIIKNEIFELFKINSY